MNERSVLCAVDFSFVTEEALRFAAEEALMRDACLDIVHVWNPTNAIPMDPMGLSQTGEHQDQWAREQLDDLHVPFSVSNYRKHLRTGLVRDVITDLASQLDSELLVVGSHSQPALARWILGSVAQSLTKVAPCPVVVVRPKQLQRNEARRSGGSSNSTAPSHLQAPCVS